MEEKYTIIQSFWTKPMKDKDKLSTLLYIAALSLTYAHRSGYKVNMHTDSYGYELLKDFGYDNLYKTLDEIPDTVPTELFAAGKFYAMKSEGITGKLHIDFDVFIKKEHLLDKFYEDKTIDIFAQQEEAPDLYRVFENKIKHMFILGYPSTTRPNWQGSINVGVVGFNNEELANKYFNNYFEALKIYTKDKFEEIKQKHPESNTESVLPEKYRKNNNIFSKKDLEFDFILEQVTLSYYSIGYNIKTLVPMYNPNDVANQIGYQHLQGTSKWKENSLNIMKSLLKEYNNKLFNHLDNLVINI